MEVDSTDSTNSINYYGDQSWQQWIPNPWEPWMPEPIPITPYPNTPNVPTKTIKRITCTIEKYGPIGEYLGREVITEDLEDVEVPDYSWKPDYNNYPIITCNYPIITYDLIYNISTDINSPYNQNVSFTSQN